MFNDLEHILTSFPLKTNSLKVGSNCSFNLVIRINLYKAMLIRGGIQIMIITSTNANTNNLTLQDNKYDKFHGG